jgi:hypothetical protein
VSWLLNRKLCVSALSYNQPKFCPNASWNPNATTFADNSIVGINTYGIFVNTNNTVYVANQANDQILVWLNGSINLTTTIFSSSMSPVSLFVTITGDIFISNWYYSRVEKWLLNATVAVPIMSTCTPCYGLFIDISDTLYCSTDSFHQVVARSLNSNGNTLTTFGTGICGNASNMLCHPHGIFVNINFDLYVADSGNNRIQLFKSGESNATTIIINGTSGNITLTNPTGVVLDADGYLFIVDSGHGRIIGSDVNGFRCVAGCSGAGSAAYQLILPNTLNFDSYGNMFVTDSGNNRIQKFILSTNSCGKCDKNVF